jgi:hypothetical protein
MLLTPLLFRRKLFNAKIHIGRIEGIDADSMTYEITPEHFGFTTQLKLSLAVGSLACFVLPMIIFPPWSSREIIAGLLTWLFLEVWWNVKHNYSLEVDDNSVRVVGGRVIRKCHVRYAREFKRWPWREGTQLVLSEHSPLRARLFGGVIVIPKGLPEYEQIKEKVFTWTVNFVAHAI